MIETIKKAYEAMIQNELQEIIQKRDSLESEDYWNIEKCWKEEVELLSKDINATIDFLDHECTGEQFVGTLKNSVLCFCL